MANIKPYTDRISSAQYGEEVRGSIVNALTAMNDDINADTASAKAYSESAASSASEARERVEQAVAVAIQEASEYADSAADSASEAAATEQRLSTAVQDARDAETSIEAAEQARVEAENGRVNAESERVSAEQARESQETGYVAQCADYTTKCKQYAESDYARAAESWAIGGTGSRYGEDTNNAKFWCSQAEQIAGGDNVLAFNGRQGMVIPEAGDYDSTMIQRGSGTVESALSGIESALDEKADVTDISNKAPTNHASNASTYGLGTTAAYGHVKTINNLTTEAHTDGAALSAYQGKVLKDFLDNKVSKSGDTMTGNLKIQNNAQIQITDTDMSTGTAPTSAHYGGGVRLYDANGVIIGSFQQYQTTTDATGIRMGAWRTISGSSKANTVLMTLDNNGNAGITISHPDAWRTALGAAASSHNHAASNITSGTLPIARGGTGGATVAAALGNLMISTSNTSDLNSITTPGLYYISGTPANIPEGSNGLLTVIKLTSNYIKQIFQRFGTPAKNDGNIYTRETNNGGSTWGSWATHYAAYRAGDTLSGAFGVHGFITNSGNSVYLEVPLMRPYADNTAITCAEAKLAQLRTVSGGYIGGGNSDLTSYIVSVGRQPNGIVIRFDNDAGWGFTNNTPISGLITLTLNFS